jgi:hypothetical protein
MWEGIPEKRDIYRGDLNRTLEEPETLIAPGLVCIVADERVPGYGTWLGHAHCGEMLVQAKRPAKIVDVLRIGRNLRIERNKF